MEGNSHSVDDLCAALWPRAASLAFLLTGDRRLAHKIAKRAIARAVAHWRDRRNPYALDAWLNRTVVAMSLRSHIFRSAVHKIRRPEPVPAPANLNPLPRRVWRELYSLRFKVRAALVLSYFVGANDSQSADALGISIAGARSLASHGIAVLGERVRSDSIESELGEILRSLAVDAGGRPAEFGEFSRRIRAARLIGVFEVTVLVGALTVGAYVGSESLADDPALDRAEAVVLEDSNRSRPAALQMEGAPGWCPTGPSGEMPDVTVDNRTGIAQTFVVALTKRFEEGLRRYSDSVMLRVAANDGPALSAWPRLPSVSALRIRYQGSGATDIVLRRTCGASVARSTWIIVYEDNSGQRLHQLAIYLSQRAGEWSVWGTYKPALIL